MVDRVTLPVIRSSERVDFKRCPKKWFWAWRMGLVPKAKQFGALDLGAWVHEALALWYTEGLTRKGSLVKRFREVANAAIRQAVKDGAPEAQITIALELFALGEAMMKAYRVQYGMDSNVIVIQAEIPLEFDILDESNNVVAIHRLKPDLVYRNADTGEVWLMEHKTAGSIKLEHLTIDDQAKPYLAMAERALREVGAIGPRERLRGIMYNFLRKATPDERPRDAQGYATNKPAKADYLAAFASGKPASQLAVNPKLKVDELAEIARQHGYTVLGARSKSQPLPSFVRHPIPATDKAKAVTMQRLRTDAVIVTALTEGLQQKKIDPALLPKTPHRSCPKFCDYFTMCELEENGGDIRDMRRSMYLRRNPYTYDLDTADEPTSFELG